MQESYEISVRNRKDSAVTVLVRESLNHGEWHIVANNHKYTKRDAITVDFPVEIAANSEAKVAYTVLYSN